MDARLEILEHLPQPAFAVTVGDDGFEFVVANRSYLDVIGWPADQRFGGPAPAVLPDATLAAYVEHFKRAVVDRSAVGFETDANGGRRTLAVDCSPLFDAAGVCTHVIGIARDVTEQKRVEAALAYHTRHDPLTNLPNRVKLVETLADSLVRTRGGSLVGLVFIDLDDFEIVNDSLGHDAGDALLTVVARRIERALRAGDSIARFGGDELAIVCNGITTIEEVRAVAERVQRVFDDPFALDAGDVFLTASIGIALSNGADDRPDRLMRDADAAVSYAKSRGRASIEVFDEPMRARAVERLEVERDLRLALGRHELRVHYQPLVRFDQSEVIGFEALLRWEHPERGLLSPDAFLGVAEDTGLIVPIGSWVLHESCAQASRWATESEYETPLVVAVNVAARQLVPEFVNTVEHALAESGLPAESLVLEITERVLVHDTERIGGVLTGLCELGVQIAVDDFGTGQTALAYLKALPIHSLKIDRSFVDGLGESEEDDAIVAAVVSLGHALGLSVTAEGVETPRQLSELRSLGCDLGQGYYFARPQPGEVVRALVHRRFQWKQPA